MKKSLLLILLLLAVLVPWTAKAQTPHLYTPYTATAGVTDNPNSPRTQVENLLSEDFEDSSIPDGWTVDGGGDWYVNQNGGGHGEQCAYSPFLSNGNYSKLISPVMDLSNGTQFELTFMRRMPRGTTMQSINYLYLCYRNSADGDWTRFATYSDPATHYGDSWVGESFVLPNPSSHYQIAFEMYDRQTTSPYYTLNPGEPIYIDLVEVDAFNYRRPTNLRCSEVAAFEATLDWDENADATSWQICLNDDETQLYVANSKPFTVTDLEPQTIYTARVRGVHGDEQSGWSPVLRFTTNEPEPTPVRLRCTAATPTTATLGWVEYSDIVTGWQICLNGDETHLIDAPTNPFTLTGLTEGAICTAKVRALMGNTTSDWSDVFTFQPAVSLPYATSFEDDNNWQFINGNLTNQWMIGTATHNGEGSHALYISNDGSHNTYSPSWSKVYATKTLDLNAGFYQFNYDWKCLAEGSSFMRVGLVPVSLNLVAESSFVNNTLPEGWISIDGGNRLNGMTEWQNVLIEVEIATAATYKMVFLWQNMFVGTPQNPPAAIDNVVVTAVAGQKPSNLHCTSYTDTSVTLDWTENGTATAWQICLDENYGNLIEVASHPYTIEGLIAETEHTVRVRSSYGSGAYSAWCDMTDISSTYKLVMGLNQPETTDYLPFAFTQYALTQQIYTAAELGGAIEIRSLDFRNTRSNTDTGHVKIYLVETTQNDFVYPYNTVPFTDDDCVFDANNVSMAGNAWTTLNLNTPFVHHADKNLVVIVFSSFYPYGPSGRYRCYETTDYQTLKFSSDSYSNPSDLLEHGSSSNSKNKNLIRIGFVPSPPTDLTVSNFTSQGATLGWTENGPATSWQICLNDDMNNLIEANSNPFTLTGLTFGATYTAKVRANYGFAYSDWSNEVSFRCLTITYAEDFENGCDGWDFIHSNNFLNKWYWGTAAHNGSGTHGIYISDDGGTSNHYTNTTNQGNLVFASKTFDFDAGTYNFSYDWRCQGEFNDLLRAFLVPANQTLSYSYNKPEYMVIWSNGDRLPSGWIALDGSRELRSAPEWQAESHDVMVPTTGSWKVVFAWFSNWESEYNPPAAIDNLRIAVIGNPSDLHCTATTATTATLAWTENVIATNWQICIDGDETNLINVSQNPYMLTGLTFGTTYTAKVRANYGNEQSPWSNEISFTANVGIPTDLQCTKATPEATTLTWTDHNSDINHWEICLNGDESNPINANSNPFTIPGLTINNTYTAKVRSNTGNGISPWSDEISFMVATALPYTDNFETSCDWIFEDPGNDNLNAWVWGTATSNGGTHSLYVSNDGGAHWEYTSQQVEASYAYKYFWFEPGVYHLSFDWKADGVWGENSGQIQMLDYLDVTLRDENYHAIYGSYNMGRQVRWQTVNADVTVSTAGVYRLEFQWVIAAPSFGWNDTGWPAAIDNVSITPASSLMPTNLQCTAASNTQATLGWTENNSNATGWQICLNGNESNLIDASTNPFTLTNLATDATYTAKVRSITPNGESAWSDEISFVPTIKTVLGTGTETSVELPFANHTDVETQQIYTADELGAAGDILSIGFFKTGTTTCTRNLDIYMALTTTNKYTTAGDWVNTGNGQLVFSGTVSFADDAWTTINLATPFHYDGQQNLAITVIDNTGSTGGQARFLSYTAPEKQTIVYHSINQALTAYLLNDKSQIRMLKSTVHTAVTGYDGEDDGNWQLVALPIAGTIDPVEYTNMITSSTFDLYRFNHSAAAEWENWKNTESDHYHFNMESGHGYLYANNEDIHIVFSGTPYSGNGQVTLSKDDNARFGQWNLIGNPFSTNATIGSKPFYIMNDLGTEIIPATDNTIAAMQGVFVEADQNGEVITFMAQSRGGENANEDLVLNLCKGPSTGSGNATTAAIDRVIVRMDKGEALHKLQIKDDNTKVYIPLDGKDYAIVTIGRDGVHTVSTGVNEIPVNFHAAENGTYTFTANFEGVEMEYLHLIDNMTCTDIDLLQTPEYTFTAKTTDYESRFRLVFTTNGDDASAGSGTFAFFNGSEWQISNEGKATLQVIDVMGRVLSTETISGNAEVSIHQPAGIYMLRLVNGDDVKVQKVVVH